jgi:hypothetical protein
MLVYLHKEEETATQIRYRVHTDGGVDQFLVLDKQDESIQPDDGNSDGVFRAAAGKLAKAWISTRVAPDRLVYSAWRRSHPHERRLSWATSPSDHSGRTTRPRYSPSMLMG